MTESPNIDQVIKDFPHTYAFFEKLYKTINLYSEKAEDMGIGGIVEFATILSILKAAEEKGEKLNGKFLIEESRKTDIALDICSPEYKDHPLEKLPKLNQAVQNLKKYKKVSSLDKPTITVYNSDLVLSYIEHIRGKDTELGISTAALERLNKEQLTSLVGHELRHPQKTNRKLGKHDAEYDADGLGGGTARAEVRLDDRGTVARTYIFS